jgi:hypothetical protein
MSEELRSVLIGTAGLSVALALAAALSVIRRPREWADVRRYVIPVAVLTIVVHALHAAEEFLTGFHRRFPATFDLAPWSPEFFLSFNIVWIAIWLAGVWGLSARRRSGFLPVWFLAVAGAVNGIAHPLLAVGSGGYFQGLATAPFLGVAAAVLLRRLVFATGAAPLGVSR